MTLPRIEPKNIIFGAIALALIVGLIFFPSFAGQQRYISLGITVMIFSTAAYGLYFLFSQSGQLSVAHGALMGLGGYTVALLQIHYDVDFWLALPAAIVVCVTFGFLLALPSIRVSGHYFLVVTFAFAQFFVLTGNNWYELTNGRDGLIVRAYPSGFGIFNFRESEEFYRLCVFFLLATIGMVALLQRTKFCRTLRAARENEALAQAVGMNVQQARFIAFAISGIFPAIAGSLYVYHLHHIEPNTFGMATGVNLILMLILGGGQVLFGPLVGSATYTFLPEFIGLSPNMSRTVFGALLVASILIMKRGVAGTVQSALDYIYAFITSLGQATRPKPVEPVVADTHEPGIRHDA